MKKIDKKENHIKAVEDAYTKTIKDTEKLIQSKYDIAFLIILLIIIGCGIAELYSIFIDNIKIVMASLAVIILCSVVLTFVVKKSTVTIEKQYRTNYMKRKKAMKHILKENGCIRSKGVFIEHYSDALSVYNQTICYAKTWNQVIVGMDSAVLAVLVERSITVPDSHAVVQYTIGIFAVFSTFLIIIVKAAELYNGRFATRCSSAIQILRNLQIEDRVKGGKSAACQDSCQ